MRTWVVSTPISLSHNPLVYPNFPALPSRIIPGSNMHVSLRLCRLVVDGDTT